MEEIWKECAGKCQDALLVSTQSEGSRVLQEEYSDVVMEEVQGDERESTAGSVNSCVACNSLRVLFGDWDGSSSLR